MFFPEIFVREVVLWSEKCEEFLYYEAKNVKKFLDIAVKKKHMFWWVKLNQYDVHLSGLESKICTSHRLHRILKEVVWGKIPPRFITFTVTLTKYCKSIFTLRDDKYYYNDNGYSNAIWAPDMGSSIVHRDYREVDFYVFGMCAIKNR